MAAEDFPVAIDEIGGWQHIDLVVGRGRWIRKDDVGRQFRRFPCHEDAHRRLGIRPFISIRSDQHQAPGLVLARQLHQKGDLRQARLAPARPEVEENHFASQPRKGKGPAFVSGE